MNPQVLQQLLQMLQRAGPAAGQAAQGASRFAGNAAGGIGQGLQAAAPNIAAPLSRILSSVPSRMATSRGAGPGSALGAAGAGLAGLGLANSMQGGQAQPDVAEAARHLASEGVPAEMAYYQIFGIQQNGLSMADFKQWYSQFEGRGPLTGGTPVPGAAPAASTPGTGDNRPITGEQRVGAAGPANISGTGTPIADDIVATPVPVGAGQATMGPSQQALNPTPLPSSAGNASGGAAGGIPAQAMGAAPPPSPNLDPAIQAIRFDPTNPQASIRNVMREMGLNTGGPTGQNLQQYGQAGWAGMLADPNFATPGGFKGAVQNRFTGGGQQQTVAQILDALMGAESTLGGLSMQNPGMDPNQLVGMIPDPATGARAGMISQMNPQARGQLMGSAFSSGSQMHPALAAMLGNLMSGALQGRSEMGYDINQPFQDFSFLRSLFKSGV